MPDAKTGALKGITVIDLSRLLPGPYASMILADHGARVIVVEDKRFAGEFFPDNAVNRGKEHICLNLKSEAGKKIFFELVRDADVVLEGFRPGVTARLGVDYESVRAVNPAIVYCSITGYGQSGDYAGIVGHDSNYLSVAGVLGLIGEADGRPVIPGIQIADMAGGGMNAVIGIMMALFSREKTGSGQYIDISMTDGCLSLLSLALNIQQTAGQAVERGNWFLSHRYACYNTYETADGRYLSIGAVENRFWKNLCDFFQVPEYIPLQYDDARRKEILDFFEQQFRSQTLLHWQKAFESAEICWAPVKDLSEALADPVFSQRDMVLELVSQQGRRLTALGAVAKLSQTPARVSQFPPEFGENTRQVLAELGYKDAVIDDLAGRGVI
ncbi:crotonobetainyl-CoA:carnitine CoA-transferase CaiB-like acyl-CoA transferase [Desulfosalsimonas propionicica]|uniref:Crotonobetainyl-CoA:carnitine CoA-transferase CaiB-like acyl-CoA transferase n=1 Tax=Desulfosalsimonas propionicica TaxID=332175 RepID=A0A7W0C9I0_9BACT|nr:CaiB/BaiF CoA-transferase family protein [Desulfosalsimonas propionicica]MBA2881653.1 crotonobetainyl-CoA:carnitine CoA-transferase CaiB-like acyl-CoA transferase [Desulfosalsimonas propionicica]